MIRVSGDKKVAEETLNDLDNELLSTTELVFDVSPFINSRNQRNGAKTALFDFQQLESAARLTQSVISEIPLKQKIIIRSTQRYRAESAHRFLVSMLKLSGPTRSKSIIGGTKEVSEMTRITSSDFLLPDKISKVQKQSYGRLASPQRKETTSTVKSGKMHTKCGFTSEASSWVTQVARSLESQKISDQQATLTSSLSSLWEVSRFQPVSATLGQLMHKLAYKDTLEHNDLKFLLGSPRSDRLFVNAVPQLRNHLKSKTFDDAVPERSKIVCHLIPSPWSELGKKALDHFPKVKMIFEESPEAESGLELVDVLALTDVTHVDLLLPNDNFDVRFVKQYLMKMTTHGLDNSELSDYVSAVKLSYSADGDFRAPLKIRMRVPMMSSLVQNQEETKPTSGQRPVNYIMGFIEHCQPLAIPVGRLKLHYTAVEAGQVNGSYGRFNMDIPVSTAKSDNLASVVENLQAVDNILHMLRATEIA